jgi:hypothetical protein
VTDGSVDRFGKKNLMPTQFFSVNLTIPLPSAPPAAATWPRPRPVRTTHRAPRRIRARLARASRACLVSRTRRAKHPRMQGRVVWCPAPACEPGPSRAKPPPRLGSPGTPKSTFSQSQAPAVPRRARGRRNLAGGSWRHFARVTSPFSTIHRSIYVPSRRHPSPSSLARRLLFTGAAGAPPLPSSSLARRFLIDYSLIRVVLIPSLLSCFVGALDLSSWTGK